MKEKEQKLKEEVLVKTLMKGWKETRQLTLDWIDKLTLEQLNQELPRPGLNSFTKHIYEMGEVQKVYIAALKEKESDIKRVTTLTFESQKMTAQTKKELVSFLNTCDREFYKAVKDVHIWGKEVLIFGEKKPKIALLEFLIRHESLHHGQFIVFGYMKSIEFPKSWIDAWALPSSSN